MIKKLVCYIRYVFGLTCDKILSYRMLITVLVLVMFHDFYLRGMSALAAEYEVDVVPFLMTFLCGRMIFSIIFGLCILYIFSEAPYMNRKEMYFVARTGRVKWGIAQSISIFITSVVFIAVNFLIDIIRLIPNVSFENKWDKLSFSLAFGEIGPNEAGIAINEIVRYSPYQVALYGFVMGVLVANLIGQLMYAVSILFNRVVAMFIGAVISIMSVVARNTAGQYAWVYFLSPVSWTTRGRSVFARKLPEESFMIGASLIVWLICVMVVVIKVRGVDFDWKEED